MQLDKILEENSTQAISKKTMISEENIELLFAGDFSSFAKAKAMGFISILERDYNVDLSQLKKDALSYYDSHTDLEESINIALPQVDEKKERSKLFPLLIFGLLAYASWYFFTQFDKKTLGTLLPFGDDKLETPIKQAEQDDIITSGTQTDIVVASIESQKKEPIDHSKPVSISTQTSTNHVKVHTLVRNRKITLLPEKKLWFGLVDMENGERKHFSITKQYEIDVTKKSWLLATSPAGFALINHNETKEYNDARTHYFKVTKTGVQSLTRAEYIVQGGYKRW